MVLCNLFGPSRHASQQDHLKCHTFARHSGTELSNKRHATSSVFHSAGMTSKLASVCVSALV